MRVTGRLYYNKMFLLICMAIILSMTSVRLANNSLFKGASYVMEFIMIYYLYSANIRYDKNSYTKKGFIIVAFFLVVNFIISPYDPEYVRLLKYFTYYTCCMYGIYLARDGINIKCKKFILYTLILTPLLLVILFDRTPKKTMFFTQGNTFTFWGLNCAILYYILNESKKWAFVRSVLIALCYVIASTSLGVLASAIIIILLKNKHNIKLMALSAIMLICLGMMVLFSDIPLFSRIRSVLDVFSGLSFKDIFDTDVSTYELEQMNVDDVSGRNDNASSIWRLRHWGMILTHFITNWHYSFVFGLGDSFSQVVCGHNPHNDYLRVLAEFGMVCFGYVVVMVRKCAKILFNSPIFYFIGTALIYFGTDNSSDFLPGCALFFFLTGYYYEKKRKSYVS